MTGWEVQEMWERDTAALWERLNAPDPAEKYLEEASKSLKVAVQEADKAADSIAEAAAVLSGWPMQYKLDDLVEAVENIRIEVNRLAEMYGRGVREEYGR